MPDRFLPLFPLNLVAFPGEKLNLHIFEPRYKQLIGECRDHQRTFGIPPYVDGKLSTCGTEMQLEKVVREYPNGEIDIVVRGVSAFLLDNFVRVAPGKLYGGGSVQTLENDPKPDALIIEEIAQLYQRFHQILRTGQHRDDLYRPDVSFSLANEIGLSLSQRAEILAMPHEAERERFILDHLRHVVPVLEAADSTRVRIQANGTFHKHPTIEL